MFVHDSRVKSGRGIRCTFVGYKREVSTLGVFHTLQKKLAAHKIKKQTDKRNGIIYMVTS